MNPENVKNRMITEIKSEFDLLIGRVVQNLDKLSEDECGNLTDYVSRTKAAELIGVSLPTLSKLTKEGKLKKYSISKKSYYLRSQLLHLISNNIVNNLNS